MVTPSAGAGSDVAQEVGRRTFNTSATQIYERGKLNTAKADVAIAKVVKDMKVNINPSDYPKVREHIEGQRLKMAPGINALGTAFGSVARGIAVGLSKTGR